MRSYIMRVGCPLDLQSKWVVHHGGSGDAAGPHGSNELDEGGARIGQSWSND
jgi:hypothetical protein